MVAPDYTPKELREIAKMGEVRELLANTKQQIRALDARITRLTQQRTRLKGREASLVQQVKAVANTLGRVGSG